MTAPDGDERDQHDWRCSAARRSWREPFAPWGPPWATGVERSLDDLVADGFLPPSTAAFLALAVGSGASVAIAAEGSGAGKTTLLLALMRHLPLTRQPIWLRGCYEPFDFTREVAPDDGTLVANEIGPHLPVYLWGPAVARALALGVAGYQLLATLHAASPIGAIRLLTGEPLRVPIGQVLAFDLLVQLATPDADGAGRGITGVTALRPGQAPGGIDLVPIVTGRGGNPDPEGVSSLRHPAGWPADEWRTRIADRVGEPG